MGDEAKALFNRLEDINPLAFKDQRGVALATIESFKRQVEHETFSNVLEYQRMRICLADKSRCVEVLAGNIVKEAIENGAIAELRGLEAWVREQQAKEGA